MSNIIECRSVSFSYNEGNNQTSVLKNLNFEIKSGETTAIIGQSGCGKSTLLNLMAGLDNPTEGVMLIDNINISKISETDRTDLRAKNLGFVYQFHHLLNDFPAIYNVALPLLIMGSDKNKALLKSKKILTKVGLENRLNHKPSELSGGERQRVAIARAMITEPTCLLADEPTGNLDPDTAMIVFNLLMELVRNTGMSAVIATHNYELSKLMDRQLALRKGKLVEV